MIMSYYFHSFVFIWLISHHFELVISGINQLLVIVVCKRLSGSHESLPDLKYSSLALSVGVMNHFLLKYSSLVSPSHQFLPIVKNGFWLVAIPVPREILLLTSDCLYTIVISIIMCTCVM